ncbi:MAG: alanine racemase [Lachnospiraceae bacterium]|nr:alanine racemase [Lachnospiraceae bacterium]
MNSKYERGYALVDLVAIRNNVKNISRHLGDGIKLTAVIKADAYGHGAVEIGKVLDEMDEVYGYATATAEEAFELADAGIKKPVLVLNYTFPYSYPDIIKNDIRITVFRQDELKDLNAIAKAMHKKAKVHIKVDTGMGRIGVRPDDSGLDFVRECISDFEGIEIEGIFSHFAKADETDKESANGQLKLFNDFVERVGRELSFTFPIRHIANSAAICDIPAARFDMCRAGIILYGLRPSDEVDIKPLDLKPALSLYSHVIYVKECEPGTTVSYGSTYVCDGKKKIATIPIGYADGYPRSLSNKGFVLIHGKRAKVLGKICMDQFMVDVTDIPNVKEGDLVTLIGKDGNDEILLDDISALSGRFNYEFVCCLGNRIKRIYN